MTPSRVAAAACAATHDKQFRPRDSKCVHSADFPPPAWQHNTHRCQCIVVDCCVQLVHISKERSQLKADWRKFPGVGTRNDTGARRSSRGHLNTQRPGQSYTMLPPLPRNQRSPYLSSTLSFTTVYWDGGDTPNSRDTNTFITPVEGKWQNIICMGKSPKPIEPQPQRHLHCKHSPTRGRSVQES